MTVYGRSRRERKRRQEWHNRQSEAQEGSARDKGSARAWRKRHEGAQDVTCNTIQRGMECKRVAQEANFNIIQRGGGARVQDAIAF